MIVAPSDDPPSARKSASRSIASPAAVGALMSPFRAQMSFLRAVGLKRLPRAICVSVLVGVPDELKHLVVGEQEVLPVLVVPVGRCFT